MGKETEFRKFFRGNNPYKMTAFDDYVGKINSAKMGYINPYIIETREENLTQMDIFSKLMQSRIIYFCSEVDDTSASIAISQLLYLDSVEKKDITMYIMSPGGSCLAAFGMLDTMDITKSDIATVSIGLTASAASLILSNGTKGKRASLERSRTLLHTVRIMGHGITGPYNDLKVEMDETEIINDMTLGVLAKNTGKSLEEVKKDTAYDCWLSAEQCLMYGPYGIIDKIITKDRDITRSDVTSTPAKEPKKKWSKKEK